MKTKKLTPAKKRAWKAFSEYIRARDALKTTGFIDRCRCVTCGKDYPTFGLGCIQAGHFIAGRGNSILFSEEGVHGQCYGCNVGRNGAHVDYFIFMESEYGRDKIDELMVKRYETVKYSVDDYRAIEDKYKKKLALLYKQTDGGTGS